jgi:hypothetical protein
MGNGFLKPPVALFALAVAAASAQAVAQTAPKPAAREAEPVGRLFFTPAQRASLDIARTRRARTTLSSEQSEEAAPVAQTITYGGMVRRSDGKSTMWVNNRAISDSEAATGAIVGRVGKDGSITLQLPQSGRSVDLKPGQSIELLSGTIEEGYSRKPVAPEITKPAADAGAGKPAPADRAREAASDAPRETAAAKPGAPLPESPASTRPAGPAP